MIKVRKPGENTPAETRHDANESVNRQKRYKQILEIMTDAHAPMTAKEIAVAMLGRCYTSSADRNNASPRLTELMHAGIVEPAGKKKCAWTGKAVTAYRIREEGVKHGGISGI